MQPTPPFWFRMRQGKMEPAGPDSYRLTAPNLAEALISIRQTANGHWQPVMRSQCEEPEMAAPAAELESPQDAWEAAFELYRERLVV